MNNRLILTIAATALITACGKPTVSIDTDDLKNKIISNYAQNVYESSYIQLAFETSQFNSSAQSFAVAPTDVGLQQLRSQWKQCRATWEKTESWLFGPVSTDNIDPRIDTWPVDFNALDSVMNNNSLFNATFINGLDDALKGFHPAEYLIWGSNGNKQLTDFTQKERAYLSALCNNLQELTSEVANAWQSNYKTQFLNAGKGSTEFTTRKAAFLQVVEAMAGICDEVANGKIDEPFVQQNPLAEESPFAKNSLTDFKNNLTGVLNVYTGNFNIEGEGIDELVKHHHTQLHNSILQKHSNAITSLNAITLPFGEAIIAQPIQVQNAINAINELKTILDTDLKEFVLEFAD